MINSIIAILFVVVMTLFAMAAFNSDNGPSH